MKDELMKNEKVKNIAKNNRARFDYQVESSIQAGIELEGCEVKSLRLNKVSFSDAYASIENGQCMLSGLHIATYDMTKIDIPEPTRERKLLLRKNEIKRLEELVNRSGYTLIPLELYFVGSWVKVKLGLCKGKTHGDKRIVLKEKAIKRDQERDG